MNTPALLPCPRFLEMEVGRLTLPRQTPLSLPADLPGEAVALPITARLQAALEPAGVRLALLTGPPDSSQVSITARRSDRVPTHPEGYSLSIRAPSTSGAGRKPRSRPSSAAGVLLEYRGIAGLRAGVATLRQLLHQYGRRLPALHIRDYPDFPRRGVMLDVSRGRVPRLQTLLGLVDTLADFKINEFQLYIEHTFAYRDYASVWRGWGALTAQEIRCLDSRCQALGIDLVPNQNSFGHLRQWLEYPPLRKLAEVPAPYEGPGGAFLRHPTTLAPNHPGTLPFLRGLYDQLLPCFSSPHFNVGCDETWDLGRGRSRRLCAARGQGRVYLDFLKQIHREVTARGRRMMVWGDIVLNHPELLPDLPRDLIALNWGYDAGHPFSRETAAFAQAGLPFYVCPGTSTWMTLIGRHDNALANLREAAIAGKKHGAAGYLITDWGDGGHPQPLAVSFLPYLAGASLSWCSKSFHAEALEPVLSREVFQDQTGAAAQAAMHLGLAHRQLQYMVPNLTPLGTVIAAPLARTRDLFCRDGLKYYARIPSERVRATQGEVHRWQQRLRASRPATQTDRLLVKELDLAARMAEESCAIMLWQQALAQGRHAEARRLAKGGISNLRQISREFDHLWPLRNKGTTAHCSGFLKWRHEDYLRGRLVFPPDQAREL